MKSCRSDASYVSNQADVGDLDGDDRAISSYCRLSYRDRMEENVK